MKSIAEIFRSHAVFDAQGRHTNGTDKESNHHYGDAYERMFPDRSVVELVMEVGVADGSCLRAWRDAFPNATVVGLDVHNSDLAFGDRIEFHLGNQLRKDDCLRAVAGRQFDLIVEDGTHNIADTLLTLYWLWPSIKPGGLYVVEEWYNITSDRNRVRALWPDVEVVGTCGPHIQDEPLVVLRKLPI